MRASIKPLSQHKQWKLCHGWLREKLTVWCPADSLNIATGSAEVHAVTCIFDQRFIFSLAIWNYFEFVSHPVWPLWELQWQYGNLSGGKLARNLTGENRQTKTGLSQRLCHFKEIASIFGKLRSKLPGKIKFCQKLSSLHYSEDDFKPQAHCWWYYNYFTSSPRCLQS